MDEDPANENIGLKWLGHELAVTGLGKEARSTFVIRLAIFRMIFFLRLLTVCSFFSPPIRNILLSTYHEVKLELI